MNKIVYDQFEIEFEKDEIALEFDASKSDWTFITKHTPLVNKTYSRVLFTTCIIL